MKLGNSISSRTGSARGRGRKRNNGPLHPQPDFRSHQFDIALPQVGGDAVLTIVRPTVGPSIRTTMSGRSWTMNAAYASARSRCTIPIDAGTDLTAAWKDEAVTSTVKIWGQPCRVELRTSTGKWSTVLDRARLEDDLTLSLIEFKHDWAAFNTEKARRQVWLGQLAAEALGAKYVREVRSSLGTATFIANCEFVQTYRFVPITIRQRYIAQDLLDSLGTVSLGRLADALASDPANGMAVVCAMMVHRIVSIDLERKISRDSAVRAVPPLPGLIPGLFDALEKPLSRAA